MATVTIHEEITALRRLFTVDRIMVPVKQLKRVGKKEAATRFHEEYDVVPFPYRGSIKGYFHKKDQHAHGIDRSELIGGSTSILDAIGLFANQEFFFVLYGNDICGYLHYSDLNHPHTRIPIFGLLQLLEQHVWNAIARNLTDQVVQAALQGNWQQILRRRETNKKRNLDTGWSSILYLPELIKLGTHLERIGISQTENKSIVDLRNKVMHPAKNLVSSLPDLKGTTTALKMISKYLKYP